MIKHFLLLAGLLFSMQVIAQTGIGTSTPDPSAKLHVASDRLGFLPPQVTLTSTTDNTTIRNVAGTAITPAVGLLVYNLGSVGLQAGYYYWNGANWATIATGTTAGNAVIAGDLVKLYQETYSTTAGKASSSTGYSFTVPVSGRYEFNFNCTGWNSNGSLVKLTFNIREGTNVIGTDYHQSASSNAWVEYEGRFEVNLTAGVTYNAQVVTTTGRRDNGYDWDKIMYKMVAGNLPVNQHMAAQNVQLNNNFLSNDGGNEGIRIDNSGNVGVGTATPGTTLHIENSNNFGPSPDVTTSPSLYINNNNSASTTAHSTLLLRTNGNGGGNPYLSFDITNIRGYSMGIDNADADKFKFHTNWNLNNSASPALTITSDGRVGIGTSSPAAGLHVASSVTQAVTDYGYLAPGGTVGRSISNQNISYSIQADQRIRTPEINTISDLRIKTNIAQLNTSKQLAELNKLKTVNYSYIDQLTNGNKNKTGFIAQEVEAVNNQFVNQSADFIPSVFALAKSATLLNNLLQVTTDKPHEFKKGEIVKFFAGGKKEIIMTIESIDNSHTFSVKGWNESTVNLFIYGKKVTDFRAIDFDQITALSVAAIQELSKQIERLKAENANLKKTLSKKIENNQLELEKRLLKLEAKFNQ
jgi:hypothetical protein